MPEASGPPTPPPTVVVDLPPSFGLWAAGGVLVAGGLFARCFARWLAWPDRWEYHGDRANTVWAYREAVYADLGLVALAFGLSLVWLAVARRRTGREGGR